ncbi:MAG: hypothetical protein CM1200mP9_08330 [Gammaproteobacteria bacterium]|nr:MAG: hypothetical protein CM1200mP9_08330 [Gammaproteobacteria bacterium]
MHALCWCSFAFGNKRSSVRILVAPNLPCRKNRGPLHVYVEAESKPVEAYEPSIFFASSFTLRENRTFATFLEQEDVAVYVTMTDEQSGDVSEFQCDTVRGTGDTYGYSCRNSPPSDILMLNPEKMRFTRGAVGGWTFYSTGEDHNGTSLFVE